MIRLVPRLFARLEKCSLECIIPLDINEFFFVRYMFQFCCKVTCFLRKTYRMCYLFLNFNQDLAFFVCTSAFVKHNLGLLALYYHRAC